jgi:hypothetical protein
VLGVSRPSPVSGDSMLRAFEGDMDGIVPDRSLSETPERFDGSRVATAA